MLTPFHLLGSCGNKAAQQLTVHRGLALIAIYPVASPDKKRKEMKMRIPNQSCGATRSSFTASAPARKGMTPQLWSWENRFPGLKQRRLGPLLPPSPSCDLDCGGERADCFRLGGSRDDCNNEHRHCLMECFFSGAGRIGAFIA